MSAALSTSEPSYPGAVAPERTRALDSFGLPIRLSEWGDPAAPPVVLCHGMFDHGRGFDTLAPLLAERFRVIAIDARGHGESGWCDAYPWHVDVLDVVNVLRSLDRPARVVGHSRGGGLATDAAIRAPELVRQLANLDGFGPPPDGFGIPGVPRDARSLPERFADFLDDRRRSTRTHGASRVYASLDDLVERRRAQNPRLTREWLRYFVFHAARPMARGWVWKADLRAARGFGPWKPEWVGPGWRALRSPMLAVIGSEPDTWGPLPESILGDRLANVAQLERATVAGAGHFIHMEQPRATADLLLSWLDRS
ncbi:MAG TPA: alpha/beta hydrolase [Candidatus Binatia bacterium]|nr:alpha/beta hydrolase [Candidatus Binatia bacterium]